TPGDDVTRIVPIGRFRHVGLLSISLRAGRRQIAVPVVKGEQRAADQTEIARARRVGDHGHGRNGRKADDAIRSPSFDCVDVSGGDDFAALVPSRPHETAAPAHGLVGLCRFGIVNDRGPCLDWRQGLTRLAPGPHQPTAHHRIFDAARAVEIPAIGSAARTTPRLMVRHAWARTRIVGLLRFPSNDAALDIDLPTASTRAVHAMRRAYDLVVLPALPVALLPRAVLIAQLTVPLGERLAPPRQISETFEKMAHGLAPVFVEATAATEGIAVAPSNTCSPITGKRRTSVV